MDEEEYYDDPWAYVISLAALFVVYILIILFIYIWRRIKPLQVSGDRQGNNFAASEETGRDNRYNDIFFIEPNSVEAARIRAQLEKDDKDLPSYDDVMRMTDISNTPPNAAPLGGESFMPAMPRALVGGASSSSVNTTDTTITIPPARPLTPPPYTPEPLGATVVVPITMPTALHTAQQQPAQSL